MSVFRKIPSLSLALLLFLMGCGPDEEITTNTVVRVDEPRKPIDVLAAKQQLHHTLVAILPAEEIAWFFKVSGPAEDVEGVKQEFLEFMGTLEPAKEKKSPPAWKLPEGWQEKGPAPMRAATLSIPGKNGEVELAVSSLPLSGEWDGFLYRNVERWQGQLQQEALPLPTIHEISKKVQSEAGEATVLHLVGRQPQNSRPNPHAGMSMSPPAKPKEAEKEAKQSSPVKKPAGPLAYETPEGWLPGRMSMMRKAAFNVVEGNQRAEVTVISFPTNAGPMMTDPVANVKRWAGEVGIQGIDAKGVDELSEPIEIDGNKGIYVELLGPEEGGIPLATLAAMFTREDQIWFFKIKGDLKLVQQQREAFEAFMKSVSFK